MTLKQRLYTPVSDCIINAFINVREKLNYLQKKNPINDNAFFRIRNFGKF